MGNKIEMMSKNLSLENIGIRSYSIAKAAMNMPKAGVGSPIK